MKRCSACGVEKTASDFHKDPSNSTGLSSRCKACATAASRAWRAVNRERELARKRAYRAANIEKVRARQRLWADINAESCRHARIQRNYGISADTYARMLAEQQGKCAICQRECRTGKRLAVDHCHNTGDVRGLLCASCNPKLGWYEKHRDAVGQYLRKAALFALPGKSLRERKAA